MRDSRLGASARRRYDLARRRTNFELGELGGLRLELDVDAAGLAQLNGDVAAGLGAKTDAACDQLTAAWFRGWKNTWEKKNIIHLLIMKRTGER